MELCNGRKSENDQRVISLTTFQFQDVPHCHYLRHELLLRNVFAFYIFDVHRDQMKSLVINLFLHVKCSINFNSDKIAQKDVAIAVTSEEKFIISHHFISEYPLHNALQ